MRRPTVYLHADQAVRLERAVSKGVELVLAATPTERPRPSLVLDSGHPTWADRTDEIRSEGFGKDGYDN